MFTGIIAAVGQIDAQRVTTSGPHAGRHIAIASGTLGLDDVAIGDSIAINGVCLTVTAKDATHFEADVSEETLRRTVGLERIGPVNLEKALRLGDALGGHLVSGHVDGIGHVVELEAVAESYRLVIDAPLALARFIAYKGSVTVNGVSLTINALEDSSTTCRFSINLIPHTLLATTLGTLTSAAPVNLEVDMIARYAERMLSAAGLLAGGPRVSG